jgi:hypothetical protein
MTNKRSLLTVCATICMVFVLALVLGVMAQHGTAAKAAATPGKTLADGGGPPPPDDDDEIGVKLADGGGPPPPDDDDEIGGAKLKLADGGGPPPPDDDDEIAVKVLAKL